MLFEYNFITLYGAMPCASIQCVENMKRLLHILLSTLSFGGMSCVPFVEEEVDMYAAPYTEYHPSSRVDCDSSVTDVTTDDGAEQE